MKTLYVPLSLPLRQAEEVIRRHIGHGEVHAFKVTAFSVWIDYTPDHSSSASIML